MNFNKLADGLLSLVNMASEYRPGKQDDVNKNDEAGSACSKEPDIKVLYKWEKGGERFAPGTLVYVGNGKGMLRTEYYDDYEYKSFFTLMFGDEPLFQFQGNEYYCPTCEKIVKSGYNLEDNKEFSCDAVNVDGAAFDDVVEQMKPLLGLLEEGYYCLWDTALYPTDGNGDLFWDFPNDNRELVGSCAIYLGNCHYATETPHFTIATQPKRLYNPERAEYYRDKPGSRAIAYCMDGNITALIDGHHKAMAAAMEHRQVSAVVITHCTYGSSKKPDGSYDKYLLANMAYFYNRETGVDDKTYEETYMRWYKERRRSESYKAITGTDDTKLSLDTKSLAAIYPTAREIGGADYFDKIDDELIDSYMKSVGGAIEQDQAKMVDGKLKLYKEHRQVDYIYELQHLIEALEALDHPRFFELVDWVLHASTDQDTLMVAVREIGRVLEKDAGLKSTVGSGVGGNADTSGVNPAVRELRSIAASGMDADGIRDYLINYMTEIEDEYPIVGKEIFRIL